MSGRKSKEKGYRFENACVKAFQACGFDCRRMPLSGALGGEFAGDLRIGLDGRDRIFQLKCLANGYRTIYAALAGHDGLIIKADREEPLVVLPLAFFLSLAAQPEGTSSAGIYTAEDGVSLGASTEQKKKKIPPNIEITPAGLDFIARNKGEAA